MNVNKTLFELAKKNEWDTVKNILASNSSINVNLRDEQENMLISYAILTNRKDIVDLLLSFHAKLDFIDNDGHTILYNPIRFAFNDIINILLNSKYSIGVPLTNIIDKYGNTSLHYCSMFNNNEALLLLLKANANKNIQNNKMQSALHIAVKNNYINIVNTLLSYNVLANIYDDDDLMPIHVAVINYQYDIVLSLLNYKNTDINAPEKNTEIVPIMYLLHPKSSDILKEFIKKGVLLDKQDIYGNTVLHYAVNNEYYKAFNYILSKISDHSLLNMINIDGNTALHLILQKEGISNYNLTELIKYTDLNLQDNNGNTCLYYLIKLGLWKQYENELKIKPLDIFVTNHNDETIFDMVKDNNEFMNIVVSSFYHIIMLNPKKWKHICKNDNTCIKEYIIKNKISVPSYNLAQVEILDNVAFNTFIGFSLDVLSSYIYLYKNNKIYVPIFHDIYTNKFVKEYYDKYNLKLVYNYAEFYDTEILWSHQHLYFPSAIKEHILKFMNSEDNLMAILLGIHYHEASHANILIIDKQFKTIERFEPHGKNDPIGFYYNGKRLDAELQNTFLSVLDSYTYIIPSSYLPKIGFQYYDSLESSSYKKMGDPHGFCIVWCIWYAQQRALNINIEPKILVEKLIIQIKRKNIKFRDLIRNFARNITDVRDKLLANSNNNLNEWLNNNVSEEKFNKFKDYLKVFIKKK